jgi:hypothetical protein
MNSIFYDNVILHYLKKDYEAKSIILNNLSIHIENLYDNFVLTTDDKRKINILVNDTINLLNDYYNFVKSKLNHIDINDNNFELNIDLSTIKNIFCDKKDFNSILETTLSSYSS